MNDRPDARNLLQQSVSIRPHAEAWHNLAVVHHRLGEADLARRAEHERDRVSRQAGGAAVATDHAVRWVDAKTFATSAGDVQGNRKQDQELAATATGPRR